jgi:DNA primase
MHAVLDDTDIEQLKRNRDTLRVYNCRLRGLQKSGQGYVCKCPFHPDNTPSFGIYLHDGVFLFKCLGCGVTGNVIQFLMRIDGISFPAAVEAVKEYLGTERPSTSSFSEYQPWNEAPQIISNALPPSLTYDESSAIKRLLEAESFLVSRGISMAVAEAHRLGVVDYPGLGKSLTIRYTDEIVKVRTLNPFPAKGKKFRHYPGHSSVGLLYNIQVIESSEFSLDPTIFITESELDCLMMETQGFHAVSVSSATACLTSKGTLTIQPAHLEKLKLATRIYIATDQDEAGQKCAAAFERILPRDKTYRLTWPYQGGR